MAWKLPRDGGGFNAGFDQSGGEQLWQAKTVSPTDPGVYRKGSLWGSKLTHGGMNVNEAVEDYQDWSRKWGSEYKDENERLEKYKYKFGHDEDTIRRGFYRNYPSSYDLDFTIDDLNEQWYLPKEAPEDYEWLNQGGIASLENRPGYRWGGSPHLDLTKSQRGEMILKNTMDANRGRVRDFGVDWDRGYGKRFNDLVMLESRLKQPTGRLLDDTVRTTFQNALQHGDSDRRYDFAINRATDYGKSLDEDMSLTQSQRDELEDYIARYNPMAFRAEGGAVGLEPGISSLMGYAKGGMVTRVKVPKGQSKWMKRFVNNMRDS